MNQDETNQFWETVRAEMAPTTYFDALGNAYEDIDQGLYEAIEGVLVPELGAWEHTTNWWHETDFHGDGIRTLMFSRPYFRPSFLNQIQAFLTGQSEKFVVVILVYEDLAVSGAEPLIAYAVFSNRVLASGESH